MENRPLCRICNQPLVKDICKTGDYYDPCDCLADHLMDKLHDGFMDELEVARSEGRREGRLEGRGLGYKKGIEEMKKRYAEYLDEDEYLERLGA